MLGLNLDQAAEAIDIVIGTLKSAGLYFDPDDVYYFDDRLHGSRHYAVFKLNSTEWAYWPDTKEVTQPPR